MCEKECSAINISDVLSRHPRHPSLIHIKKYNVKERRKLFEQLQGNSTSGVNSNEKDLKPRTIHNSNILAPRKDLLNLLEEDESVCDLNYNLIPPPASRLSDAISSSGSAGNPASEARKSDDKKSALAVPPVPVFASRYTSRLRSKNSGQKTKSERYGFISDQPFKSTLISKVVWTGVPEASQEKSDGSESGVFLNEPDCPSDENSNSPLKVIETHSSLTKSRSFDEGISKEIQRSRHSDLNFNTSNRTSEMSSLLTEKPFLPPKPPRLLNQLSCNQSDNKTSRLKSSSSSNYEFLSNTHSINPVQSDAPLYKKKCSTFPAKSPTSSPEDKSPEESKLSDLLNFQARDYSSIPQDLFLCKAVGVSEMKDRFERQSLISEISSSVNKSILIKTSADDRDSRKKNLFKPQKSKKFVSKGIICNPNYEFIRVGNDFGDRRKPQMQTKVTFKEFHESRDAALGSKFSDQAKTNYKIDCNLLRKFTSVHDERWRREILEEDHDEPTYAEPQALNKRFVSQSNVAFDSAGYAIPSYEHCLQFTEDELEADKSVYMRGFSKEERSYFKSKVSDAYSILRTEDNPVDDIPPAIMAKSASVGITLQNGSASEQLDFLEHEKRLNYVSTIRRLTFKNVSKYEQVKSNINLNLFEYALIVGLKPCMDEDVDPEDDFSDNFSTIFSKSNVIFSWPENLADSDLMTSNFCFPDASGWKTSSKLSGEMFCFFLTTNTGDRKFCWCLRYLPQGSDLPEAVCVVSMIGEAGFYQQLLNGVREARMHSLELAQETLKSAYQLKLPRPNKELYIIARDLEGFKYTGVLKRTTESHYSTARFGMLVHSLPVSLLIHVLSSILLERRVILLAQQLSTLSSCIMSFSTLLYPFTWPHTLITVLPPSLVELIQSPTPYILGMFSSYQKLLDESLMDEVLVVDLDGGCFLKCVGDESRILPKKIQKALTLALTDVSKENPVKSSGITDVTLTEAFLRMFVEMCGHYKDFIMFSPKTGNTFQGEEFVRAASSNSIRLFLEWFSRTQMFQVFIHDRMKESFVPDLFDQRIHEYKKEIEGVTNSANMKFIRSKFFNFFKSYGTKIKKSLKKNTPE